MLILGVFFNFNLDVIFKYNRFFKILLKKGFKFVLYKKINFILLHLSLVLLLAKVDFIIKEKSNTKDTFVAYSITSIEIILALLMKVVTLNI